MTSSEYPYIGGDPIEVRHSYTYTPYGGEEFLKVWRAARRRIAVATGPPCDPTLVAAANAVKPHAQVDTLTLLDRVAENLSRGQGNREVQTWLRWLVQRFEVTKRVYERYEILGRRVVGVGDYRNLTLYLRLAEVFAASTQGETFLPGLNALMKCLDTLCSHADGLDEFAKSRLARLILVEDEIVGRLRNNSNGLAWSSRVGPRTAAGSAGGTRPKRLSGMGLLLADTLRSRAYVQALRHRNFHVPYILIVNALPGTSRWGQSSNAPTLTNKLPGSDLSLDLRTDLAHACDGIADQVERVETGTVNHDEVIERIKAARLAYLVYSGFGGEIVSHSVLANAPPMLHLHAGWLPDYRGSTTTYYSLLRDGACGCSAIILNTEIDKGEVVARKLYPPPPAKMDIDYEYDGLIRSDLLLTVMDALHRDERLPRVTDLEPAEGETYYIIHPVLKHVAILNRIDADVTALRSESVRS